MVHRQLAAAIGIAELPDTIKDKPRMNAVSDSFANTFLNLENMCVKCACLCVCACACACVKCAPKQEFYAKKKCQKYQKRQKKRY